MVPEHLRGRKYPSPLWTFEWHVEKMVRECLLSEYLGWEMSQLFKGTSEEELEAFAASFRFENCVVREELNEVLKGDAEYHR
jgi:hypothetical protein